MTNGRQNLFLTLAIVVLIVVIAVVTAHCQLVRYDFPDPGLHGMVSNIDPSELLLEEALYLENTDVNTTMGILQKRMAVNTWGTNSVILWGVTGYYNPLTGHKLLLGVTDNADYSLGQFVVSDTFGVNAGSDTLLGNLFPWADVHHGWTSYKDITIGFDGKSIPVLFSTTQYFKASDSTPDTLGYQPHLISMGLEAPGQPRVTVYDTAGDLSGTYQYAFSYWSGGDHGNIGISSALVYPDAQKVAVTLFPHMYDTVLVCRRKMDGQKLWYIIDTVFQTDDSHVVYIDGISDTISVGLGTIVEDSVIARPGQPRDNTSFWPNKTGHPIIWFDTVPIPELDTFTYCLYDSTYRFAYSFYDPVTEIESPLGPAFAGDIIGVDTNTIPAPDQGWIYGRKFNIGYIDTLLRPKWVRWYQGIVQTDQVGGGDTMVWYGLFEMRATDQYLPVGQWDDTNVVVGLDSSYITIDTIYWYEFLRDWQGEVKILPPYSYDCQIPFSDIEYLRGRLWAIGDPANSNYIYYSAFDNPATNIFSWHPFDFLVVPEIGSDEFIALELAEGFGEDMLYAFTHNSIWIIDDQGNYEAISTRIGAVLRETIVKRGEAIYFMSPEMKFYVLRGTSEPVEISKPVENWIDSSFVSYSWFSGYGDYKGRAMTLGDHVIWSNDSTGKIMAFNTKKEAGTWSMRTYQQGGYKPRGSFPYDTLHTNEVSVSFTTDLELLYGVTPSDSSIPFRQEVERNYDVAGAASDLILLNYQTPHLGDGFRRWQVSQIRIKVQPLSSSTLHYAVYDDNEDSLCGGIYAFSGAQVTSGAPVNIFLAPPYNIGDKLSVKLFTAIDSASDGEGGWQYIPSKIKIYDHSVWLQDMGAYDVQ